MSQPSPVLAYAHTLEDASTSNRRKLAAAGLITSAAVMLGGLAFSFVLPMLFHSYIGSVFTGYASLISNGMMSLLTCLAIVALALLPLPQRSPLTTALRFTLIGSAILVLLSSLFFAILQMATRSEFAYSVSLWAKLAVGTLLTLARIAWLSLAMHTFRRRGMLIAILASGFLLVCTTIASTTCTHFLIRDLRAGSTSISASPWWFPSQITSIIHSIAILAFAILLFLTAFRLKPSPNS